MTNELLSNTRTIVMKSLKMLTRNLLAKTFIYFLGLFLIGFKIWTNKYFGSITIDQALTTISFNFEGTLTGDAQFLHRFLAWCVIWPLLLAVVFAIVGLYCKRSLRHAHYLVLMAGIILVCAQYHIPAYIKQHLLPQPDYFAQHYQDTAQVAMQAQQPKNLVLIYVESLETTYSNPQLFQRDLLAKLNQLPVQKISFQHYRQMPGTEWSVAGIISTQCAVPLKLITIFSKNNFGEQASHILPGAYCLGDILAAHGYQNIYMNGSDLNFGGVGKFFRDHHYQELLGRSEWLHAKLASNTEISGWGLHDDDLLAQAKIKLKQLENSNKPFNLTIFTIDTHGPDGHLNQRCAAQH